MSTANAMLRRTDVARAARELEAMKGSLRGWLEYRTLMDSVIAGQSPAKLPPRAAAQIAQTYRDWTVEQKLADHLHALLTELMPEAQLPSPSLAANRNAAVALAQIALHGQSQAAIAPQATGAVWMWPALIVGGLLLAVTTAVKSYADVAKERERYACIKAGACTDYGFWLKAGAVVVLGWFAWEKLGVGAKVTAAIKGRK